LCCPWVLAASKAGTPRGGACASKGCGRCPPRGTTEGAGRKRLAICRSAPATERLSQGLLCLPVDAAVAAGRLFIKIPARASVEFSLSCFFQESPTKVLLETRSQSIPSVLDESGSNSSPSSNLRRLVLPWRVSPSKTNLTWGIFVLPSFSASSYTRMASFPRLRISRGMTGFGV